jgi:hypothetical protein
MSVSSITAVNNALAEVAHATQDWTGYCLKFVRIQLGIGASAPSAIKAWQNARNRKVTGVPPAGVPVFWRGGQYGHVALSAGNGYCYSTDVVRRGKVDKVLITEINRRWGYTYLGWTTDLNGRNVNLPVAPPPPSVTVSLKALQFSAKNPGKYLENGKDDVLNVKGYLVRHGYAKATDSFATAYQKFQQHLGWDGKNADGVPGMMTLRVLARSANWRIVT